MRGAGRVQPIDPSNNTGMMGLGKATQDHRMLDSTTLVARQLESQRIAKETPDQLAARKVCRALSWEERLLMLPLPGTCGLQGIRSSRDRLDPRQVPLRPLRQVVRSFLPLPKAVADRFSDSYATVGQYDEHTNSYDHHHKARAVALKLAEREKSNASGESERRREKEAKREAKEMAKKMGAAGIAVPTASVVGIISKPVAAGGAKKGGWAKVGGEGGGFAPIGTAKMAAVDPPAASTSSGGGGFKKSGWATVGGVPAPAPRTSSPPPPSSAPPDPPAKPLRSAPAFKSGGLFTLSIETHDEDFSSPLAHHSEIRSSAPAPPATLPPPPLPSYQPPPPPPASRPPPPPSSRHPPPPSTNPPPPPSTLPPPPPSSRPPPPSSPNKYSVPSHTLPTNSMDWRPDHPHQDRRSPEASRPHQNRRRSPEATRSRNHSPEERRSSSGWSNSGRSDGGYERRDAPYREERDERRAGWDNPRYPPYDPPPPPSYDRSPPPEDYYPRQSSREPPSHHQPHYDSRRQPSYEREQPYSHSSSYPNDRRQTSYDDSRAPQSYAGRSRGWEREGDGRDGYGRR